MHLRIQNYCCGLLPRSAYHFLSSLHLSLTRFLKVFISRGWLLFPRFSRKKITARHNCVSYWFSKLVCMFCWFFWFEKFNLSFLFCVQLFCVQGSTAGDTLLIYAPRRCLRQRLEWVPTTLLIRLPVVLLVVAIDGIRRDAVSKVSPSPSHFCPYGKRRGGARVSSLPIELYRTCHAWLGGAKKRSFHVQTKLDFPGFPSLFTTAYSVRAIMTFACCCYCYVHSSNRVSHSCLFLKTRKYGHQLPPTRSETINFILNWLCPPQYQFYSLHSQKLISQTESGRYRMKTHGSSVVLCDGCK